MATPEFVLALRRLIGHAPLWLPGVTAVVIDAGRVLLVRRADSGAWTPVTGIVDPGEHPAAAAVREVREESGVDVAAERLAWVRVHRPVTYANGDHAQYLDHVIACRYLAGDPHAADDESTAAGWFALDGLPELAPRHRAAIDVVCRRDPVTRLAP